MGVSRVASSFLLLAETVAHPNVGKILFLTDFDQEIARAKRLRGINKWEEHREINSTDPITCNLHTN